MDRVEDKRCAGEGESIAGRVVAAVRVAVLTGEGVLALVHHLDAPMIAIDPTRGGTAAGRPEIGSTVFFLRLLAARAVFRSLFANANAGRGEFGGPPVTRVRPLLPGGL